MGTEYHNSLISIFKCLNNSHEDLIRTVCNKLNCDDRADELVSELLDTSYKSVKPKKDPNRVRKPKNAFMFFCDEKRKETQEKNPDKKMGEISKILGAMWKSLDEKSKKKFNDMHEDDVKRYEEER